MSTDKRCIWTKWILSILAGSIKVGLILAIGMAAVISTALFAQEFEFWIESCAQALCVTLAPITIGALLFNALRDAYREAEMECEKEIKNG